MTRNSLFVLSTAAVLLHGAWQAGTFILWLIDYLSDTGFSLLGELLPLALNCLGLIAGIFMWILRNDTHRPFTQILAVILAVVSIGLFIAGRTATDPLQLGLPAVMITIPLQLLMIGVCIRSFFNRRSRHTDGPQGRM